MRHELKSWGLPSCICGFRRYDPDKAHAIKMVEAHVRSEHDLTEHVAIIHQLVDETAAHPNVHQDVALAILHLTECLSLIVNDPER